MEAVLDKKVDILAEFRDPYELDYKKEIFELIEDTQNRIEEKKDTGTLKDIQMLNGRLIERIRIEINKLLANPEDKPEYIEKVTKLSEILVERFEYQDQIIKKRTDDEFLHKRAGIFSIFTMFPKAVYLNCCRLANCIRRIKVCKTTEEKTMLATKLAKDIGLVAGTTPVFAAKYIADNWYLFLAVAAAVGEAAKDFLGWLIALLASILSRLKKKGKGDDQTKGKGKEVEPEPSVDPSVAPSTMKDVVNIVTPQAIKGAEPTIKINPAPGLTGGASVVPQIDPAPGLSGGVQTLNQKTSEEIVNGTGITPVNVVSAEANAVTSELPNIHFEEGTESYDTYMELIRRVNERSNGHIYIREVAKNPAMGWDANPNLIICNEPGEYIRKICELYKLDTSKYFDSTGAITPEGYNLIIERHMMPTGNDTRLIDVIFQDPESKYLPDFIKALPKQEVDINRVYDNISAINCFETVDEFTAALMSEDTKYQALKENVTHFINVSETQEAIDCLASLGIVVVGGAIPYTLLGGGASMGAAAAASSAPGVLEVLIKLLQVAPEKAMSIYEVLRGLQNAAPALAPGM